jgi:hypothetical protein
VEARFEQHEEPVDAYITAGEKAVRTSDDGFRDGLARLIAAGLRDDAKVDAVSYYVSLLTQVDPIHLRYLPANIKAEQAIAAGSGGGGNPTVTFVATLAEVPPEIARSAAERLHAFALLTDRLRGDMVTGRVIHSGLLQSLTWGERYWLTAKHRTAPDLNTRRLSGTATILHPWLLSARGRSHGPRTARKRLLR